MASTFSLRACCLQTEDRSCHRTRRVRCRVSHSRACREHMRARWERPRLHTPARRTLSRAGREGEACHATRAHQRQIKPQELQKTVVRRGAGGTSGAPARTSNENSRKARGRRRGTWWTGSSYTRGQHICQGYLQEWREDQDWRPTTAGEGMKKALHTFSMAIGGRHCIG